MISTFLLFSISMEEAKDVHKSLRKAAGIFHFIQNQYLTQLPGGYKGGEDLDPRVLGAYSTQCTAEAQEGRSKNIFMTVDFLSESDEYRVLVLYVHKNIL